MQEEIRVHDYALSFLSLPLMPKVDEAFKKNEWIHAEIEFEDTATFNLHFKEENNADHIQFTNPYGKKKLDFILTIKRKLDELEHIYQNNLGYPPFSIMNQASEIC
jgi:hypothetical protein